MAIELDKIPVYCGKTDCGDSSCTADGHVVFTRRSMSFSGWRFWGGAIYTCPVCGGKRIFRKPFLAEHYVEVKKEESVMFFTALVSLLLFFYVGHRILESVDTWRVSRFVARHAAELAARMDALDSRINTVKKEIERIEKVQRSFPDQRKVLEDDVHPWRVLSKELRAVRDEIRSKTRAAYVQSKVREAEGVAMLMSLRQECLEQVDRALEEAGKVEKEKGQSSP